MEEQTIILHGNILLRLNMQPQKQGQNKITFKVSCIGSITNFTKFYSVNVTGIGTTHGANGQNGQNGVNGSFLVEMES